MTMVTERDRQTYSQQGMYYKWHGHPGPCCACADTAVSCSSTPPPTLAGSALRASSSVQSLESTCTHGEEHEEPLILLSHTVVHPWAVMVHLSNASLANTAKESTLFSTLCSGDTSDTK